MNRIVHENQSNDSRAGSPPQGRGEAITSKVSRESSGADRWCCAVVGFAVVESSPLGRLESVEGQAPPWSKAATDLPPEAAVGANPASRPARCGLPHRDVVLSASGGSDRASIWRAIPCRSCLASAVELGLELPKARTTGSRAKRTDHPPVAQRRMAANKKGERAGKLASCFLMKQVFSSNPRVAAPAPRGARHRSS